MQTFEDGDLVFCECDFHRLIIVDVSDVDSNAIDALNFCGIIVYSLTCLIFSKTLLILVSILFNFYLFIIMKTKNVLF
jgi:hypothetical protein